MIHISHFFSLLRANTTNSHFVNIQQRIILLFLKNTEIKTLLVL